MAPGEIIIHDGGKEFVNGLLQTLMKDFKVKVNVTLPGRPQGNGQAESVVKNVKNKLRMQTFSEGNQITMFQSIWNFTIFFREPRPGNNLGHIKAFDRFNGNSS